MTAYEAKIESKRYRDYTCIKDILMDIKNHTLVSDVEYLISERNFNAMRVIALMEMGYEIKNCLNPHIKNQHKISWEIAVAPNFFDNIKIGK